MTDAAALLVWWLTVSAAGLLVWPLAASIVPQGSASYVIAKVLAPGLLTLLSVFLSTLRLLPMNGFTLWGLLLVVAGIAWLLPKTRAAVRLVFQREKLRSFLALEAAFLLLLVFWSFMRGLLPGLDSLEKMMNIGFLESLARSAYLPAADMWYAGGSINYYYGGHIAMSIWNRLSFVQPVVAYNLAIATLFSLTALLAWSFGANLLKRPFQEKDHKGLSAAAGALSALLVTFAGNGHAVLYDEKSPLAFLGRFFTEKWPAVAGSLESFWFPASTRYIGYNPDLPDKTIHEFPYYSFLVADLHAHLINLVFVLSFLILLQSYLLRKNPLVSSANLLEGRSPESQPADENGQSKGFWLLPGVLRATAASPLFLATAAFLSFFMIANYWDFVMYFAVTALLFLLAQRDSTLPLVSLKGLPVFLFQAGGVLLVFLFVPTPLLQLILYLILSLAGLFLVGMEATRLGLAGWAASFLFFLAHLLVLPFNLSFEPIAKNLKAVEQRTSLYQFLVLWGLMLVTALFLNLLLTLRRSPSPGQRLLLVFFLFGLVFLLVPELVYVVDIYGGEYKRANTMFKFTYQAFVLLMLVIGSGPSLFTAGRPQDKKKRTSVAVFATVLIASSCFLWYPLTSTTQWYGPLKAERYVGLDGTRPLRSKASNELAEAGPGALMDYFEVIDWMKTNIEGQPTIVEAYGPSYTDYCLVSAFTGLPTVLGWETHEWLWRTTVKNPDAYLPLIVNRQDQIRAFYTAQYEATARSFVRRYRVRYIVIGPLEEEQFKAYGGVNSEVLELLANEVLRIGGVRLLEVDAALLEGF